MSVWGVRGMGGATTVGRAGAETPPPSALTAQEVFDGTVRHLFTQGRRAVTPDGASCLYRAPDGTRCAVGAWLGDRVYESWLEGKSLRPLLASGRAEALRAWVGEHVALFGFLQSVHDRGEFWQSPHRLALECEQVAIRFGLACDAIPDPPVFGVTSGAPAPVEVGADAVPASPVPGCAA